MKKHVDTAHSVGRDARLLPKAYDPKQHEERIYRLWEAAGYFNPDKLPKRFRSGRVHLRKPFSIVMPPPNTTGRLHLGHASSIAYEDLMVRFKRLCGYRALYLPGTDHAAIATQNKVEKILAKEGTDRFKLGREKFLDRVRAYVRESQGEIKEQIRRSGASCDWSREAYTFDEVSSRVVNEVFVQMYEDGLIYRGNRIVNWCTRCQSTLADDEVQYVERTTPFYYLKYGPVVIGTARPETKFQDKAIVVHPDDERYRKLQGASFEVPWIEGSVQARVIAHRAVDPKLGTGAMTITPAHSFEDFELAKKYGIDIVQIIDTNGKLTEAAGSMKGMPVAEARKRVVETLRAKGLIQKIDEAYAHNLSVCYRCGTPVEPLVSKQWFVDVNKKVPGRGRSLKQLAIARVRSGDITIIPDRFKKVYFHWLENLHDWCISRQIWWGHRIPVWYSKTLIPNEPSKTYVGVKPPAGDEWAQDPDTLDTWFSSATWTFSTLLDRDHKRYRTFDQWLRRSRDMQRFHPTSVLETGYDIIFFWVARMILVTEYVVHERPFDSVYLHGLVRDKQGRKMSKSLDNGIDPNDMIDRYGADALRLSLVIGSSPGQDVRLYEEKVAGYRNFVNKLWNISRFILSSVDAVEHVARKPRPRSIADAWILSRFDGLIRTVTEALNEYRFSQAGEALYAFTWQELADWYVEVSKVESSQSHEAKQTTDQVLLYILERLLILWHPFAPFVSEVLWRELGMKDSVMVAEWPKARRRSGKRPASIQEFETLRAVIATIRNIRAENDIPATTILPVRIDGWRTASRQQATIERLGRCRFASDIQNAKEIRGEGFSIVADVTVAMSDKKKSELRTYVDRLAAKLANHDFLKNAPPAVIELEQKKLAEGRKRLGE